MGLFSPRQVLVPGVAWALLGLWSPQVKAGWVQDIPWCRWGFLLDQEWVLGWSPSRG